LICGIVNISKLKLLLSADIEFESKQPVNFHCNCYKTLLFVKHGPERQTENILRAQLPTKLYNSSVNAEAVQIQLISVS